MLTTPNQKLEPSTSLEETISSTYVLNISEYLA